MPLRRLLPALAVLLLAAATASAAPTKTAGNGLGPSLRQASATVSRMASLTVSGQVTGLDADGGRVLVVSRAGKCAAAALWTPLSRKPPVRVADPGACQEDQAFAQAALATNRVLWVDFSYGNHAYCSGPYLANLAAAKPGALVKGRDLGVVCDPQSGDTEVDLVGNDGLLAFSSYSFCPDAASCSAEYGRPMRAGRNQVDLWVVGKAQATQVLPPVDGPRRLLGASQGRLLVLESDGQLVVYDAGGVAVRTIDPATVVSAARLDGSWLVALSGQTLTAYGYDGRPTRTMTLPAQARLWDFDSGLVLYSVHGVLHLLDTTSGKDRVFRAVRGLVAAQLEPNGLSYAFDGKVKGQARGTVVFVARSALGG